MNKPEVVTSPRRIDITELPRDSNRVMGGTRKALVSTFNYTRKYPAKLKLFAETLKYVYQAIIEYNKKVEAFEAYKVEKAKYDKYIAEQEAAKSEPAAGQQANAQATGANSAPEVGNDPTGAENATETNENADTNVAKDPVNTQGADALAQQAAAASKENK
tara:strand:- start:1173 stop:1655 length:483 start_codon:yes stop_codon:yes gene_type:complete